MTAPILSSTLALLSLVAYAFSIYFLNQRLTASRTLQQRVTVTSVSAVVLHGFFIAIIINSMGMESLDFLTAFTAIAWLLGVFSLSRGQQLASLMLRPAIFGFALVSVILALLFAGSSSQTTGSLSVGLVVHIVLSLLAFSLLLLATLYALQILHLNKVLKQRSAKALDERLPPLMSVEQYFFRLLTAGTIVLSLAIVAGFLFVDNLFASEQLHKTVLSIAAWLGYGSIIAVHYFNGARGRPVVIWTIIASIILSIAYFGSRIVRDVIIS
ncbi:MULTISPECIES: inner membrane protein YpjD [Gammaproteobacteria]|uniref:cytochrome C assembly family protein n=1 Tax=Gammaproteobacteria TaxID=1236 RepID=UPI001401C778|nr:MULTISPECIES: cytochrome c biogenesis protein CcsA [Gammaproteobacteria]